MRDVYHTHRGMEERQGMAGVRETMVRGSCCELPVSLSGRLCCTPVSCLLLSFPSFPSTPSMATAQAVFPAPPCPQGPAPGPLPCPLPLPPCRMRRWQAGAGQWWRQACRKSSKGRVYSRYDIEGYSRCAQEEQRGKKGRWCMSASPHHHQQTSSSLSPYPSPTSHYQ